MQPDSKLEAFIANPYKSLWKLTIPMTIGLFVNSIYILVDTYFLGTKIGTSAISALGYIMPFYFIIMGITFGLAAGVTTMVAQYIGKKDKQRAELVAGNSISMASTLSIINFIFIYLFGEYVLSLQGMEQHILDLSLDYFYVMAYGSVFMIFSIFIRGILVGEGESILPMWALGSGTILNIILDPFFIDVLGIKGAAYATIISQIIVVLIFLFFIFIKQKTYIKFSLKNLKFDFTIWKEIFHIGIPTSLSMLIMSCGLFIMNSILINDSHVAAYNLANRIENFVSLTLIALSSSQVTILGMFYGAKKHELIRIVVLYCIKCSLFISVLFGLIFYFFGENIFPIFINNNKNILLANNVINIGISYFRVFAFAVPFITIGMICSRVIQGLGKSYPMFIITCLRVNVISCSLAYYFIVIKEKPVEYAWISILISCILSSIISTIWMLIEIRKAQLKI